MPPDVRADAGRCQALQRAPMGCDAMYVARILTERWDGERWAVAATGDAAGGDVQVGSSSSQISFRRRKGKVEGGS